MPRPVPWGWAEPRIMPLLAGPHLDRAGEPIVRGVVEPGCAVIFGLDLGGAFSLVDATVAERWECSPDQIRDVAMKNVRVRAARLTPQAVISGTLSGRIVGALEGHGGWAASMLLLPDQLMRLFGEQDQIFVAPGEALLLSFPIDTPAAVVANVRIDFERSEIRPLMLDSFLLLDRQLHWQDGGDVDDEPW